MRKELRGTGIEISVISPVAVNTELGLGLSEPRQRQFRKIEPQQVADAIVETLRVPRFDVHVPKQLSVIASACRRSCRSPSQDGLSRVSKADAVLSQVDTAARAGYELRASRSEPGLPPAPGAAPRSRPTTRSAVESIEHASRAPSGLEVAEPVGDQPADQRTLVLLQEVAASVDRTRRPGGRSRAAKRSPTDSGRIGSESAHSISVGRRSSRSASSTRCPSAAPGASGACGISSGKARAPAFEAALGKGAS